MVNRIRRAACGLICAALIIAHAATRPDPREETRP